MQSIFEAQFLVLLLGFRSHWFRRFYWVGFGEEKRKKREQYQYQYQQKRRDYAQAKRDEAALRSKDKMYPASVLKDLGEAQKFRHRQEWKDLSATNKDRRQKVLE